MPSHLNESPFANSIPDSATKSNPSTKISSGRRFVFLEGTKKRNTITRVIRFDVDTEMDMEDIGDYVISNNTFGDKTFRIFEELGIATEYERRNAPSFAEYISKKRNGSEGEGRGKISSDSRVGDQRRGAPEGAGGNGSGGVNGTRQALPRRR